MMKISFFHVDNMMIDHVCTQGFIVIMKFKNEKTKSMMGYLNTFYDESRWFLLTL